MIILMPDVTQVFLQYHSLGNGKALNYLNFIRIVSVSSERQFSSKTIKKINPLGLRVLVKLQLDENVSEGGLYLPEGAKQALAESTVAHVLEVARTEEEDTNISGIPQGAKVLIKKNAGVKVPWDDTLRIVETIEVLAVINEFQIT